MKPPQKIGLSNLRRTDNARSGTDMDGACRKRLQKLESEVFVSHTSHFPKHLRWMCWIDQTTNLNWLPRPTFALLAWVRKRRRSAIAE